MSKPEETSWTLVKAAAAGDAEARAMFVGRYLPAVRAYLAARWRSVALAQDVEDAVQEVFLGLLQPKGGLDRS